MTKRKSEHAIEVLSGKLGFYVAFIMLAYAILIDFPVGMVAFAIWMAFSILLLPTILKAYYNGTPDLPYDILRRL